jgi:hypothetical protein
MYRNIYVALKSQDKSCDTFVEDKENDGEQNQLQIKKEAIN